MHETHFLQAPSHSAGVIRLGIRLYYRFTLSLQDVEDLLAERGVDVTCETVRRWARSAVFAPASASFSTPMICSSENLVLFISSVLLSRPDSNRSCRKIRGSRQAPRKAARPAAGGGTRYQSQIFGPVIVAKENGH